MKKVNPHLVPDRSWTATITHNATGIKHTTTIYGKNPLAAEEAYEASHPGTTALARIENRQ